MRVSHPPQASSPATGNGQEPFVHLQGVTKTYAMGPNEVVAVRDLDLRLPAGQFTAVVGRSGSGKSTLLHLLAAMETPTAGEITVDTWRLSTLSRKEQARFRREMMGIVFQSFNLIPSMSALDNVELPLVLAGWAPSKRRDRAVECLAMVGLDHRMDHRPTELSGGEQQRVAIARALTSDPPLLLADEPTGNLDSTTGRRIIDLLARVNREQGRSVVMVTHNPDDIVEVADSIVELHDGRLVDTTTGVSAS